jgi:hypothetical protein
LSSEVVASASIRAVASAGSATGEKTLPEPVEGSEGNKTASKSWQLSNVIFGFKCFNPRYRTSRDFRDL